VPITIRDVARVAGVHVSTVSRTFSAPQLVSRATRDRVLAVSEELGYRPNRAARGLITGRTNNLGVIVPDLANPFFPPLIKEAQVAARERDHHVFIADTDEDPVAEEDLVRALAKQVDGVLLCSPRMTNTSIERLCQEVPIVVVNRQARGLPCVLMDVAEGARLAVRHLCELGHTRLVLLAGPSGSWTNRQIRRAASAAARAAGASLEELGPHTPTTASGEKAALPVLETGATAVLAYNDLMAIGLLDGLARHGVPVPAGLSVVGVDDIAASAIAHPKLTTVSMPARAAGRSAVDLLLQQVHLLRQVDADRAATQVVLRTRLVVRQSTAPPPAAGWRPEHPGDAP
jgi:LacI family transcriptional regulator